jgi:flagellar hook-basal body complex protein FliE
MVKKIDSAIQKVVTSGTVNNTEGQNSFGEFLEKSIDEVNALQKDADKALSDVATGQIKDLHQAALSINKAETSMKLMLEVRNKAINAYKEILRTQV